MILLMGSSSSSTEAIAEKTNSTSGVQDNFMLASQLHATSIIQTMEDARYEWTVKKSVIKYYS
jgi:hypothetical protein